LRIGGLYDSRVGSTSDYSVGNQSDAAFVARLNAGYLTSLKDNLGLRFDYFGYANFYEDYSEYNLIDQAISLEPQYTVGNMIYSLPLVYNYVLEDNKTDYYRYSALPTITYRIPNSNQAIAINGIAAAIVDKDDIPELNEDGSSYGGGLAYLILFDKLGIIRLSFDYQHAEYDATVRDYAVFAGDPNSYLFPQDHREDDLLSTNLDLEYDFTPNIGLFSSYTYVHTHSNVSVYDYDRNIVEGGITLRY